MLMSAMIFSRLMTPAWIAARRAHDLVQHAVDAEADAQVVLGRLDVDVRRAVLDRLGDEQVDELDDRRVLDDLLDVGESSSSSSASSRSLREVVEVARPRGRSGRWPR
jgi:hypothetical protein